jgi:hypothetical protein
MDYGYLTIDLDKDLEPQLSIIAETLSRRMLAERADAANSAMNTKAAAP